MKKLFMFFAFISVVLLISGCKPKEETTTTTAAPNQTTTTTTTQPVPTEKRYLIYNLGTDSETWDPNFNSANDGGHIINNMFEGLFRATPTGQELAGATSYEVSSDLMTYTFHLRQDAKWSNGEPVTAQDYVFAWLRVIDPTNPSDYSFIMEPYIVGASDYLNGDCTAAEVGIKALDNYTLEVKLVNPIAYFLQLLSFYTYMPVYSGNGTLEDGWEKKASTSVSNGPFKFVEYKIGMHVLLEKNEYYWNKDDVKIDGVEFVIIDDATTALNAYNQDQVHIIDAVPIDEISNLLSTNSDFTIDSTVGTYYYVFNMDDPLIGNPAGENGRKIRLALSMAIDRTQIVENVTKGYQVPAVNFLPDTLTYSDGTPCGGEDFGLDVHAQVNEAKALLVEAGYSTPEQLAVLSEHLTLGYNQTSTDGNKKIAVAIQEMWKTNLGIEVTIEEQEWSVFQNSRQHGLYPIARAGWLGDYPDPNTMLDLFTSYSGNNDAQWRFENPASNDWDEYLNPVNEDFDEAIANAMITSGIERDNYIKEAERILVNDEVVLMPIYYNNRQNLINSDLVTGVERTQMGQWWFAEVEWVD